MMRWQYFPKSDKVPSLLREIVKCFEKMESNITSKSKGLHSNEVLDYVRPSLELIGFEVETGRRADQRIRMPVLFGLNGKPEKSFDVDAYHGKNKTVLEIEAGRAVTNYQFLKDFFEACMMYNVDYLVLAIRMIYRKSKDFEKVLTFFDTLYVSDRISLPLKGILVIGY